uniref:Uncharacterized protein n=1 Tax=Meloidogyne floridensis TaxID=298350 RepID=A0A915NQQ4_9BILA
MALALLAIFLLFLIVNSIQQQFVASPQQQPPQFVADPSNNQDPPYGQFVADPPAGQQFVGNPSYEQNYQQQPSMGDTQDQQQQPEVQQPANNGWDAAMQQQPYNPPSDNSYNNQGVQPNNDAQQPDTAGSLQQNLDTPNNYQPNTNPNRPTENANKEDTQPSNSEDIFEVRLEIYISDHPNKDPKTDKSPPKVNLNSFNFNNNDKNPPPSIPEGEDVNANFVNFGGGSSGSSIPFPMAGNDGLLKGIVSQLLLGDVGNMAPSGNQQEPSQKVPQQLQNQLGQQPPQQEVPKQQPQQQLSQQPRFQQPQQIQPQMYQPQQQTQQQPQKQVPQQYNLEQSSLQQQPQQGVPQQYQPQMAQPYSFQQPPQVQQEVPHQQSAQ